MAGQARGTLADATTSHDPRGPTASSSSCSPSSPPSTCVMVLCLDSVAQDHVPLEAMKCSLFQPRSAQTYGTLGRDLIDRLPPPPMGGEADKTCWVGPREKWHVAHPTLLLDSRFAVRDRRPTASRQIVSSNLTLWCCRCNTRATSPPPQVRHVAIVSLDVAANARANEMHDHSHGRGERREGPRRGMPWRSEVPSSPQATCPTRPRISALGESGTPRHFGPGAGCSFAEMRTAGSVSGVLICSSASFSGAATPCPCGGLLHHAAHSAGDQDPEYTEAWDIQHCGALVSLHKTHHDEGAVEAARGWGWAIFCDCSTFATDTRSRGGRLGTPETGSRIPLCMLMAVGNGRSRIERYFAAWWVLKSCKVWQLYCTTE